MRGAKTQSPHGKRGKTLECLPETVRNFSYYENEEGHFEGDPLLAVHKSRNHFRRTTKRHITLKPKGSGADAVKKNR